MSRAPFDVDAVLSDYFDGELAPDQQAELARWLEDDPAAAGQLAEWAFLHSRLQLMHTHGGRSKAGTQESKQDAPHPAADSSLPRITPAPLGSSATGRQYWRQHPVYFWTSVAALTLMLVSGFFLVWSGPFSLEQPMVTLPQERPRKEIVARITGIFAADWGHGCEYFQVRKEVLNDEVLVLKDGLVEVTFDHGAVVLLEGPAHFRVDTEQAGTLQRGVLLATVPPHAAGFAIDTPTGHIVDLGTQFGVEVEGSGLTNLHVLDGRIRASVAQGAARRRTIELAAGQSARIEKEQIVRSATSPAEREQMLALQRAGQVRRITEVSIHEVSSELAGSRFDRRAVHVVDGSGLSGGGHSPVPDAVVPGGTNPGTMWLTHADRREPHDTLPAFIVFDLGATHELSRLHVWNYNEQIRELTSRGAKQVRISVSPAEDEAEFVVLSPPDGQKTFEFPRASGAASYAGYPIKLNSVGNARAAQRVRYVRFDILSNHGVNPQDESTQYVGLSEVHFFGMPPKEETAATDSETVE